ncbi:hypothetical protein NPIL_198551 [Nephila pilipes]|uniref:Uncharacterized protein n=1 Tax=Nephila pilipes TaxID=299642 RepID=A0A8X6PXH8_NEPPI|nr:hypothetical protein NPIL_198551 [Nephila pilipes]
MRRRNSPFPDLGHFLKGQHTINVTYPSHRVGFRPGISYPAGYTFSTRMRGQKAKLNYCQQLHFISSEHICQILRFYCPKCALTTSATECAINKNDGIKNAGAEKDIL